MGAAEKITAANYTTPQVLTGEVQKFVAQTKLADLTISQTAFVYVYTGATTTAAQSKAIHTAIISAFEKNKILPLQYTIAGGGKKKAPFFELYIIPSGAADPKPSK